MCFDDALVWFTELSDVELVRHGLYERERVIHVILVESKNYCNTSFFSVIHGGLILINRCIMIYMEFCMYRIKLTC